MLMHQPPSSSSGVPSEVIQEEVQRQLRGILERLEASEVRNQYLGSQLEAYRRETQRTSGPLTTTDFESQRERG